MHRAADNLRISIVSLVERGTTAILSRASIVLPHATSEKREGDEIGGKGKEERRQREDEPRE